MRENGWIGDSLYLPILPPLATYSPAVALSPHFFAGQLLRPRLTADLLLGLMTIVQSRFHIPAAMLGRILAQSDPVVTCSDDHLRFEGFSACCGAYARVDLLAGAWGWFETTSTKVTPRSISRRANRHPWPNVLRPYWSRMLAGSWVTLNADSSGLRTSRAVIKLPVVFHQQAAASLCKLIG